MFRGLINHLFIGFQRERQEQAALLKLQGFFRGCLDRKQVRTGWRVEFDHKKKQKLSDQELFTQIHRFNMFYRNKEEDISRLLELGKILLAKCPVVTAAMKRDSTLAFAMKQIIHKCLRCLNTPHVPSAVLLRIIEVIQKRELNNNICLESLLFNCKVFCIHFLDLHGCNQVLRIRFIIRRYCEVNIQYLALSCARRKLLCKLQAIFRTQNSSHEIRVGSQPNHSN